MTIQTEEIIHKLHKGKDPYLDWVYDPKEVNLFNGWNSKHEIFHRLIEELKPKVIVEIGTFLGGSAIHMAKHLKQWNMDSAVICVDTWLAEEVLWNSPEWRDVLKIKHGRPQFYNTFMNNVINQDLQKFIVPLSMPSVSACRYLKDKDIVADLIYVDGCHIEGDVIRDLEYSWERLRPGGALFGDDFISGMAPPNNFEGLIRDVYRFSQQVRVEVEVFHEKFLLKKPA